MDYPDSFATVVYDKQTKEITVLHKKPEFLTPAFEEADPVKSLHSTEDNRKQLAAAFGSAKKQRWLRELERNVDHRNAVTDTVVINRVMSAQKRIRSEVETAKAETTDSPQKAEEKPTTDLRLSLLPPYKLHAALPEDVYPLDQALPPTRVLHALEAEIEKVASQSHSSLTEAGVYQRCVLSRLSVTSTCAPGKSQHKLIQCLVVISHMMALFKLNERQLQRKLPLPDTPEAVARYLIKEFSTTVKRSDAGYHNSRCITPTLRDRLVYHTLVLILHCDNFKTYFDDLAVDFGMACDKLRRYFVYLGCKVAKEDIKSEDGRTTRFRATLTTPVSLPEATSSKRRR